MSVPVHREGVPLHAEDRVDPSAPMLEIPAQVFLQPIAPPSILGLYGFAGATFMVAANLAGWCGGPTSGHFLFPFAAMSGGLAQFLAAMWADKARHGLRTAMHDMWASFGRSVLPSERLTRFGAQAHRVLIIPHMVGG